MSNYDEKIYDIDSKMFWIKNRSESYSKIVDIKKEELKKYKEKADEIIEKLRPVLTKEVLDAISEYTICCYKLEKIEEKINSIANDMDIIC